jgi:hypothetical protein
MQAEDYRRIVTWVADVLTDTRIVKSDALFDSLESLQTESWNRYRNRDGSANETHAHTLGGSR